MVSARDTLIIKHLPHDLNDVDKEELLKYFGAKEVKCLSSKINKYNVVFARFENEQVADQVLRRLHQLEVNGLRLSVEFTNDCAFGEKEQNLKEFENEEQEDEKCYKKFIEKLNSWHSSFDFKQPVPSHLRYQYPPPDNMVLLNIAKALATVPKFYTQVLHLMNKMNLPCPFGKDILPNLKMQLLPAQGEDENVQTENAGCEYKELQMEVEVDTSESEISSDDEVKKQKETIPDQVKRKKKNVINVPKFVKPIKLTQGSQKQKKTSIDEVFEKISEEKETKKIKLSHPQMDIPKLIVAQETKEISSGFGYIQPLSKPPTPPPPPKDLTNEREEEKLEKPELHCISLKELEENRILEKDWSVLPVFKNYAEGAPTSRLYIKNLAKTVTEEDLKYIYTRYMSKDPLKTHMIDIRLMQEGRMKGQAFITFHSIQAAHTALKETNGFILKEKPLVVQFARSATK